MKTSFFRKSAACLAAAIMTISACTAPQAPAEATPSETQDSEQTAPEEKNELTALEVTKLMGNGINLGNTMEAYNHQGYLNGQFNKKKKKQYDNHSLLSGHLCQ